MLKHLKIIYMLTVFTMLLSLSACGFHLRHTDMMPTELNSLSINNIQPYSNFNNALKLALNNAGTHIESSKQTPLELKILSAAKSKHLMSISANTNIRQYRLNYTVRFQLLTQQQHALSPILTVTAGQLFTSSANQLLGTDEVEEILESELQHQVANLLVRRLQSNDIVQAIKNA